MKRLSSPIPVPVTVSHFRILFPDSLHHQIRIKYHAEKFRYTKNANAVSLSETINRGLDACRVYNPETISVTETEFLTKDER